MKSSVGMTMDVCIGAMVDRPPKTQSILSLCTLSIPALQCLLGVLRQRTSLVGVLVRLICQENCSVGSICGSIPKDSDVFEVHDPKRTIRITLVEELLSVVRLASFSSGTLGIMSLGTHRLDC